MTPRRKVAVGIFASVESYGLLVEIPTEVDYSNYGLLGHEADCFLKRIASRLSRKWRQPYSVTCNHVRLRVNIAAIRATHLCLRGSRIPPSRISKRPAWEDSAGL